MIKRIKCKTCDDDRDMLVSGDHFICTSCGTVYDLEYIASSFYSPLMIEISFMINDLNELSGTPIGISEAEMEAPEFEFGDSDQLDSEDTELTDEEFLAAEEISQVEKSKFCLYGYFYRATEEKDSNSASAFIDTVLIYDKTNFAACLIKALESTWSIPLYIISRTGDVPLESPDSSSVSFAGEDGVKLSQELFTRICNKNLAKHLLSILSLLLTSIQNAASGELCIKTYRIASNILDLYGVFLESNTLSNLKEWPTIERYGEYVDYGLAIAECQSRLQSEATTRLFELGVSDVDLDGEHPHFHDSFPDIPNWVYHLAETEYQTAEEIWEKTVVSNIDLQTGQVSDPHQLQVLEGIFVIGLLLGRYTDIDAEDVAGAGLHELQIAKKTLNKLLNVIRAVDSFSFRVQKPKGIVFSSGSTEKLEKKLSLIDEELSKRH